MANYYERDHDATPKHCGSADPHEQHGYWRSQQGFFTCTGNLAPVSSGEAGTGEAWRDRHGDVWTRGDDGLFHTPETRPFPIATVAKKWGPLTPVVDPSAKGAS